MHENLHRLLFKTRVCFCVIVEQQERVGAFCPDALLFWWSSIQRTSCSYLQVRNRSFCFCQKLIHCCFIWSQFNSKPLRTRHTVSHTLSGDTASHRRGSCNKQLAHTHLSPQREVGLSRGRRGGGGGRKKGGDPEATGEREAARKRERWGDERDCSGKNHYCLTTSRWHHDPL